MVKVKFFKILTKVIVWLLFLIIILGCIIILVNKFVLQKNPPTLFGWGMVTVISGSMEPTLPVGSLLIVHEEENKDVYQVGDIVSYSDSGENLVTHRIIARDGNMVTTKGDNPVNSPDKPIDVSALKARMMFSIQDVGYVINFFQQPFGMIVLAIFCGLMLLINYRISIRR